jgi:6-phosphogluconolactonase
VLAVEDSPKPPPERITLSLGVLRDVGLGVLLVTGESKAPALARALGDPSDGCPASLLDTEHLVVFADEAAAAAIDGEKP